MGEAPPVDTRELARNIVDDLDEYVVIPDDVRVELISQIAMYLVEEAERLDERRFLYHATRDIHESFVHIVASQSPSRQDRNEQTLQEGLSCREVHGIIALRLGSAYEVAHADGGIITVREEGAYTGIYFPVAGFPTEGLPERDDDVEDWLVRCRRANPSCPSCGDVNLYFNELAWGHDKVHFEKPGGGWLYVRHACPACGLEIEFSRLTHVDRLSEDTKNTMPALDWW